MSHPAHALNRFSLRVRQYGTTPGRNLHLNGLIPLTGSQFVKKQRALQWFLCGIVVSRQGRIKLLTSALTGQGFCLQCTSPKAKFK